MSAIPLSPVDDDILPAGDLARLLMGDDRGSGVLPIFASRVMLFDRQPLRLDSQQSSGLFYERLRDPTEVLWALLLSMRLTGAGFKWGSGVLVTLEIEMFNSFFSAPNGAVSMPGPDDVRVGDHSVTLTNLWGDDHRLRFVHLFSDDWGEDGHRSLPLDYLLDHTLYAHATRAYGGPTLSHAAPNEEAHLDELAGSYGDPDRQAKWEVRHVESDVIWAGRILVGTGSRDQLIQGALLVRGVTAEPLLVGWFAGRRVDGSQLEVEEFFVWPPYRGRGFGTALAGRSLLFAFHGGLRTVRWLELEADATVRERLRYSYPSWTSAWRWAPARPELGWGVARTTSDIEILGLLRELGARHAPGGAQLVGDPAARMTFVTDYIADPNRTVLVERDVDPDPSLPSINVEGWTAHRYSG